MSELCSLWDVKKTHTTPYHPQANGVVERNNWVLGDSLRALLLRRGQDKWDLLLPQLMRAYRGTPHSTMGETANLMMLGRELRLPDQLQCHPTLDEFQARHEYVQDVHICLEIAHELLRQQQIEVHQEDAEEPPLFEVGDLVLLENRRRRLGDNPESQSKFVGRYEVSHSYKNHTYEIEKQGHTSKQNEC